MTDNQTLQVTAIEEKEIHAKSGYGVLFFTVLLYIAAIVGLVFSIIAVNKDSSILNIALVVIVGAYILLGWIPWCGLKVIRPNEALVLTLFGKYYGTLKEDGFFFVNPFCSGANPAAEAAENFNFQSLMNKASEKEIVSTSKKISMKAMTLSNEKQKINDEMGNPIEVGIIVIWRVVNTAKAVFQVDNYMQFVSIQADSALRDVVRQYPYDSVDDAMSLRESSAEIAEQLKQDLQERVEQAGLEISEARITHLAYAQEIAAAMLQRQQASAIVDARQKIVEGAVGMVETALKMLNENQVVELDEERKATMVSNLMVVLCGNKDAQPIVNSGSLY